MNNKDILIIFLIALCIYLLYQNNVFEGFDGEEELTDLEEELIYSLEETDDLPENLKELLDEEFGSEEEEGEVSESTGNSGGNSGENSGGNSGGGSGNTR
tara:strand:+ start:479 stop:778 length:300 start_codon:yes stop_codon:yes gene_type:complete